eukprot:scaffold16154_cov19-Tisochrysis_lutea.AAC.7
MLEFASKSGNNALSQDAQVAFPAAPFPAVVMQVMMGMLPFIAIAGAILSRVTTVMSARMGVALSAASTLAQQALSQIRTVSGAECAGLHEGKAKAEYARACLFPAACISGGRLVKPVALGHAFLSCDLSGLVVAYNGEERSWEAYMKEMQMPIRVSHVFMFLSYMRCAFRSAAMQVSSLAYKLGKKVHTCKVSAAADA